MWSNQPNQPRIVINMGGNNGQPQQGFNPFSVFDPNGFNPFAMFNGAQNNPFGQRNIQISINGQQFPNTNNQFPQQPQIIITNSSNPHQMPQPANNNQRVVEPNVSIQINGNNSIPNTTVEVLNPIPQTNSPKEATSTDAKQDNGINIGDYDLNEEDRPNWEFYRGTQNTDASAEFNFNNGVPINVTTNGNVHFTNNNTPNHPPHHPTMPKNPMTDPMNPMNPTSPFNINNPNNPNSPFNPNNPNNPASHFHPGNMNNLNNPNGIFQSNLRQQQQQQQFLRNQQMNQVHQQNTQRMNQQMHMPKPPPPPTFRKF